MNCNHRDEEAEKFFETAKNEWRKAQVLHLSPSWNEEPQAKHFAEEIAANIERYRNLAIRALDDPDPLVVAYCLSILHDKQDQSLTELSPSLLGSNSKVTIVEGSFSTSTDLGGLARKWAKSLFG